MLRSERFQIRPEEISILSIQPKVTRGVAAAAGCVAPLAHYARSAQRICNQPEGPLICPQQKPLKYM